MNKQTTCVVPLSFQGHDARGGAGPVSRVSLFLPLQGGCVRLRGRSTAVQGCGLLSGANLD